MADRRRRHSDSSSAPPSAGDGPAAVISRRRNGRGDGPAPASYDALAARYDLSVAADSADAAAASLSAVYGDGDEGPAGVVRLAAAALGQVYDALYQGDGDEGDGDMAAYADGRVCALTGGAAQSGQSAAWAAGYDDGRRQIAAYEGDGGGDAE